MTSHLLRQVKTEDLCKYATWKYLKVCVVDGFMSRDRSSFIWEEGLSIEKVPPKICLKASL